MCYLQKSQTATWVKTYIFNMIEVLPAVENLSFRFDGIMDVLPDRNNRRVAAFLMGRLIHPCVRW